MNKLTICVFVALLRDTLAFGIFGGAIPNARFVDFQGQRVIGLGHPFNVPLTSVPEANPFGQQVNAQFNANGRNLGELWLQVCELDADEDGLTNGEELCDPLCTATQGGFLACPDGFSLRHPGFDDNVLIDEVQIDGIVALKFHGWLMIFAWCIFAPYGILRAVYGKKGPSLNWFSDHKLALRICVLLNIISMISVIGKFGFEPLQRGFDTLGDNNSAGHVVSGFFVVLIAIIQPISGFFRPHVPKPGEEKTRERFLWEIQHRLTGRVGIVLAFFAIYRGLPLVYVEGGEAFGTFLLFMLGLVGVSSVIFVLVFRAHAYPEKPNTQAELEKRAMDEEKALARVSFADDMEAEIEKAEEEKAKEEEKNEKENLEKDEE